MTPEERRRAAEAHHEAGHAVVATLLGVPVLRLALPQGADSAPAFFKAARDEPPHSVALGGDLTTVSVFTFVVVTLAGRAAERQAGLDDVFPGGDLFDLRRAWEMALLVAGTPEGANQVLALAHARAVELLRAPGNWGIVQLVAGHLVRAGEVPPDVLASLVSLGNAGAAATGAQGTEGAGLAPEAGPKDGK